MKNVDTYRGEKSLRTSRQDSKADPKRHFRKFFEFFTLLSVSLFCTYLHVKILFKNSIFSPFWIGIGEISHHRQDLKKLFPGITSTHE